MSNFLLSQFLATLAFAAGLAAFQFRARPAILRCWSLCAALNSAHFLLLGVPGAATLAAMISVRFLIASFTSDRRIMVFFMILAVAGFLATYTRPVGFLALAATLLGTWASFQPNDRTVRATLAICASLWVVHNAIIGSPVATVMELAFLASNAIGWRRFHSRAKLVAPPCRASPATMDPGKKTAIERFVRGTLGCQCPEEVFRRIEVSPLAGPDGRGTGRRIVVGARLLIHMVEAPEQLDEPDWLERLAAAGREERDRAACNRFRLVVATPPGAGGPCPLQERFTRALGGDDRAHLHVLPADLLPFV